MKVIQPILKSCSSKHALSPWIISHFPENYEQMTYVEPFAGSGTILLNKMRSKVEVVNNVNSKLLNIYLALRDEPKEFLRRLNLCKCSEETYLRCVAKITKNQFDDYLDQAVNEFVYNLMNSGKKSFDEKKINSWQKNLKSLPNLSTRFSEVYIFNKPALKVIQAFDEKETLIYCDPPYLHEMKVSKTVYSSEMTTEDHIELSHALNSFKGNAIISGCQSPLYNRLYKDWNIEKKKIENSKEKIVEIIWKNF